MYEELAKGQQTRDQSEFSHQSSGTLVSHVRWDLPPTVEKWTATAAPQLPNDTNKLLRIICQCYPLISSIVKSRTVACQPARRTNEPNRPAGISKWRNNDEGSQSLSLNFFSFFFSLFLIIFFPVVLFKTKFQFFDWEEEKLKSRKRMGETIRRRRTERNDSQDEKRKRIPLLSLIASFSRPDPVFDANYF